MATTPTQAQIANLMLLQLRVLDPNVSGEIGTPERKIIDTIAEGIAEAGVSAGLISGQLDLNAKFGSDLDAFVGLFGFGRQQGAQATGFVTFSRPLASPFDITIPLGTQVSATVGSPASTIIYQTSSAVTLITGTTSIDAPIQALLPGSVGNVNANTITQFANLGAPPIGITSVTNLIPTQNGSDPESDPELQVRFKNTVFRNQAGTKDQFLALAVATQFSTKANVIGPVSRYQEYIQAPSTDDANDITPAITALWTSALSDIPYAKWIYDNLPYYISNGTLGVGTVFYRQDTDFVLNAPPLSAGDALREFNEGVGPDPSLSPNNPNVTFSNIYTGTNSTVQLITPGQIVLLEYSYQSVSTRNDITRNISNCVDVYVNGKNPTVATAIVPPVPASVNVFDANSNDKYYYLNYRRIGQPDHPPLIGNSFTALFFQPVLDLPAQIIVGTNTFLKGVHYWAVEDVSLLGGTVRSRNGIEWMTGVPAMDVEDPVRGPYTGNVITSTGASNLTIPGYTYDANIIDLQAALDGVKQVTTDILAHGSTTRYFKLDLTIMYSPGSSVASVNASIQTQLAAFFDGQYFGTVIQLSDLLQTVHNAPGVDNVRWSKDVLVAQGLTVDSAGKPRDRVVGCDVNGNPRTGVIIDRAVPGTVSTEETWQITVVGSPTGGTYTISQSIHTSSPIHLTDTGSQIQTNLNTAGIGVTVTGNGSSFTATFTSNGWQPNPFTATSQLLGGIAVFNNDFFLRDEELPALPSGALASDTLAGLILRPRAQNVWSLL